uniref:Uncharacterized protein n=1 Tax=Musca domestica TaxID=7370 RepID=A0A1I8NKC9_MUSDO
MPLIVQRQQQQQQPHHCILQGSQQQMQQRQHTEEDAEAFEVEENCTCAAATTTTTTATLANNKNTNQTNIETATATASATATSSYINKNNSRMNQMPFKRAAAHVHNIPKVVADDAVVVVGMSKCSSIAMDSHSSTITPIIAGGNSKMQTELSFYGAGIRTSTEILPTPAAAIPSPLPPSTSSPSSSQAIISSTSSFFAGILASSITNTAITTSTTTSQRTATYSTSAPATAAASLASPLLSSSSALLLLSYSEVKKYCRRFLTVISLICLLHSCLLWNTAEAAISNREGESCIRNLFANVATFLGISLEMKNLTLTAWKIWRTQHTYLCEQEKLAKMQQQHHQPTPPLLLSTSTTAAAGAAASSSSSGKMGET